MFHSGKRDTPGSAVTVSHVSDAFAIDLGARLQQIHAAANIGDQLNVALLLPFGMIEIVSQAAGPIEDGIDQQRLGTGARKNKRFGKELRAIALPPAHEDDRRKRTLAWRDDKERGHAAAFRARVGDIVHAATADVLRAVVMEIERCFRVVVEQMNVRRGGLAVDTAANRTKISSDFMRLTSLTLVLPHVKDRCRANHLAMAFHSTGKRPDRLRA